MNLSQNNTSPERAQADLLEHYSNLLPILLNLLKVQYQAKIKSFVEPF